MKLNLPSLLISAAVVTVFTSYFAVGYMVQSHQEEKTLEVVAKERLMSVSGADGSSSTKYNNFVYTDNESYLVRDAFFILHFRSGTVYARIPDGPATCNVTLSGYRLGFLSWYQNIIKADCITKEVS